jgi:hypothetical protein
VNQGKFLSWPGSLGPKLLCAEFDFSNVMLDPHRPEKNNQKSYFTIFPN